ncbi:MAG TPA: hypothetical protein VNB94_11525 [Mycobacteriales bacterium]|nr:hypothetical protein [Mycobacteriales bacterium]
MPSLPGAQGGHVVRRRGEGYGVLQSATNWPAGPHPGIANLLDFVSTDVTVDGTVYAVVGSDGPATGDDASTGSAGVPGVVLRSTRRVAS